MGGSSVQTEKNLFQAVEDWCIRHPYWTLTLLTVAALAAFLAKPFNVDDPLFVWAAQQIQSHPANPYGFYVNWYGVPEPMWAAMQNPPLMSYYLAVMAGIFGWTEIGLHLACLLPAVATVLGTYRLAINFCRRPLFAALITLFTPGFLVSSTTVMCDVIMLAFWIWAVVFWTEGVRQNNLWKLSAAGMLMALTVLAKYNGICLIPLLAAYGWLEKRAIGRWAFMLVIPVAALCAQEWATLHLYGQPHFLTSNQYAETQQAYHHGLRMLGALNVLTFVGGCYAIALFCSPWIWGKRTLLLLLGGGVLLVALGVAGGLMTKDNFQFTGSNRVSVEIQILLWTMGGMCVLALALAEAWQKRDANSWLLSLWVLGIFVFAAFIYWMANARAILPMAPAVAILITRRLEKNRSALPAGIKYSLIASAALSLLAAQADFQMANAARKSAESACIKYKAINGKLWFVEHWGFQYYMQSFGARPLDFSHVELKSGDVLIIPGQNLNAFPIDAKNAALTDEFAPPLFPWFATLNRKVGAGFYSSLFGPLPFAFGQISTEKISVYVFQ